MQKFNGYEEAKKQAQYQPGQKLPAGAYVCKILGVKYETGQNCNSDMIIMQFDITEGEYKEFFQTQYENSTQEDKKYKGVVRVYVPKDDGTQQDGWTKNAFARWVDGFEKSNPGYIWDWNEKKWIGKMIGICFGETGTVIGGKEVVYTEARSADSIDNVRAGRCYEQKFKARNGYTGKQTAASSDKPAADDFMKLGDADVEELPFS